MAQKVGVQVFVNLKQDDYLEIIERSKKILTPKTSYAKYLLIEGLSKLEKDGLHMYPELPNSTYENLTLRVPEEISSKIKQYSLTYRMSVPQLCGYIIEQELKKEAKV